MSVAASTVVLRSPTRIRAVFSNTLAAGAFSTSWFTVESVDDLGVSPTVVAALVVAGVGNEVELAVAPALVPNAQYIVHIASGVPATDLSTAAAADFPIGTPVPRQDPNAAITVDDVDALVFGEDLVWRGGDFVEGPDGDLEVISGPDNAIAALERRAVSDGLPHKPAWGGRCRSFVDAPLPMLPALAQRVLREIRADDRVVAAEISPSSDASEGTAVLDTTVTLVGRLRRAARLGGT